MARVATPGGGGRVGGAQADRRRHRVAFIVAVGALVPVRDDEGAVRTLEGSGRCVSRVMDDEEVLTRNILVAISRRGRRAPGLRLEPPTDSSGDHRWVDAGR